MKAVAFKSLHICWRVIEFLAVLVIGGMMVAIYDSDLWG